MPYGIWTYNPKTEVLKITIYIHLNSDGKLISWSNISCCILFSVFFGHMATFPPKTIFYLTTLLLLSIVTQSKAALDANYYSQTCPQAEKIILQTVHNASIHDPKVPARLLRMFFHDCFIRVILKPPHFLFSIVTQILLTFYVSRTYIYFSKIFLYIDLRF